MKSATWQYFAKLKCQLPGAPEAFQDWYGEHHPISRPDDGGTEGPERGAGGAKRRGGWSLGRGAVAPPQYEGLGAMPPENFSKNQR